MAHTIFRVFARNTRNAISQRWTAGGGVRCLFSSEPSDPTLYTANTEPPLPEYRERTGEDADLMRARLLYQSRKRGMLENGLLLSTFAGQFLDKLTAPQLKMYDTLINKPSNDWEIYYWMTGKKEVPEEYNNEVMDMLKDHAQNNQREQRIRQPDLPLH